MASLGVAEYYANKTIFITGASGFIGKVLIEKLLRCCPDVKVIYLLMRSKKGQNPQNRLDALLNTRCFEKIKDRNVLSKLYVIPGDVLKEDLGISVQDRSILEKEVQIVFHSAALVRFDASLRDIILANVLGAKRVLKLAEGIENLEAFVDISTAYCHDDLNIVEEKVYPALHRPQDIIRCVRWMNDDMLDQIQPELIKPYISAYGYSKNLVEELVSEYEGKFPIVIARPSIVGASYKEPLPGWVDGLNVLTGVMYTAASGLLYTSYCLEGTPIDLIPVDIVVNGCILLAFTTGIERPKKIRVCNITESGISKTTWMERWKINTTNILEYPLSRFVWYPAGGPKKYYLQHKIAELFLHILPAYFMDFLLILFRQKTFFVRIERRLRNGFSKLEYYSNRVFTFKNDYFLSLKNQINEKENEIFYTDMAKIDNLEYAKIYHLGIREFIAKDDISTLPKARQSMKRWYYVHVTMKTLFYILLAYYTYLLIVKLFY